MIEPVERRILLHDAFVENGILFLEGVESENDVLTITLVGNVYRAQAVNDGFSQDFAVSSVTAGLNVTGEGGNDQITIGSDITLPATLIGGLLWPLTPFTWQQSLAMAFVIVVMGFLGGLTLSAVKRSLGAKDWGVMIEGHGGMLDRLDSVSFAAPVFFHLTRFFFHMTP